MGIKTKYTSQLRADFANAGLSYADITSKEVARLRAILREELEQFDNNGFKMILQSLRKGDIEYKNDGTIKNCFLMVNGAGKTRFKRREAISFNTQNQSGYGFIGFAGWADLGNVKPFIAAFKRFMDELSGAKSLVTLCKKFDDDSTLKESIKAYVEEKESNGLKLKESLSGLSEDDFLKKLITFKFTFIKQSGHEEITNN